MHPIIFSIGPFNIYSWGFMVALAFLVGLPIALRYAEKEGIKPETVLDLFVYVVISSIIGARLFYVIGFFSEYKNNPISILYVNEGGLVFLGGIFAAIAAIIIYVAYHKQNLWKMLDIATPSAAIGYAIGRIGCLLNGCCYGITLFGVQQPTQIYSSIAGVVIFILVIRLYDKKKYDGQIFLYGLFFYSIYRFFLEFIRYNPVHILIFTPNQLLAALVFIVSSYALWKKNTT